MTTIRLFFLAFAMACAVQAANISQVIVTGASTPVDGNQLVINGVTKTWKTSPTISASHIQIGVDLPTSMANLYAFLTNSVSAIPRTTAYQPDSTHVTVLGELNLTMTASVTGVWGTVIVRVNPITQYSPSLPASGESATIQLKQGNDFVAQLAYANTSIASSITAMANFMNLSLAQTVPGLKTFTGANVHQNANQLWGGGYISNAYTTNMLAVHTALLLVSGETVMSGGLIVSNLTAPTFRFYDSDGAVDQKRTRLVGGYDGLNLYYDNDAQTLSSNILTIGRNSTYGALSAILRTKFKPDSIYDTAITNTAGGFTTVWTTDLSVAGTLGITNNDPYMEFRDANAGADVKNWRIVVDSGNISFDQYTDAGVFGATAFSLGPRSDAATPAAATFAGEVTFSDDVTFNGVALPKSQTYYYAGSGYVSGSTTPTIPTGFLNGLLAFNSLSGEVSVDPVDGAVFIPLNGAWRYRTSGASEGSGSSSGQMAHLHNRSDAVSGAGTDYTLTAATAFVDFGTTDPKVTLPTIGTYLVWAEIAITSGGTANDDYRAKLRNETTSTDLSGSDQSITYLGITQVGTVRLQTVTHDTSGTIAIWAHNNTAARGTINSARTRIGYVRLY